MNWKDCYLEAKFRLLLHCANSNTIPMYFQMSQTLNRRNYKRQQYLCSSHYQGW